jgi:hypothetical protein
VVALAMPGQAIGDAQRGAAAAGYPELWPLLVALAYYESTGNPGAIGDAGCSFGYLQFNTCGGLGQGQAIGDLLDGVYNMRLGARIIGDRLRAGWDVWSAVRDWTTRAHAIPLYQQLVAEGVVGSTPVPAEPEPPPPPPEPGTAPPHPTQGVPGTRPPAPAPPQPGPAAPGADSGRLLGLLAVAAVVWLVLD